MEMFFQGARTIFPPHIWFWARTSVPFFSFERDRSYPPLCLLPFFSDFLPGLVAVLLFSSLDDRLFAYPKRWILFSPLSRPVIVKRWYFLVLLVAAPQGTSFWSSAGFPPLFLPLREDQTGPLSPRACLNSLSIPFFFTFFLPALEQCPFPPEIQPS